MIELIKFAISANDQLRTRVPKDIETYLHILEYSREYKTVHINIGRCTGKTHAIMTLSRKNDLVIAHTEQTKSHLLRTYPEFLGTIETISTIHRRVFDRPNNRTSYDYVWIDEPRLIEKFGSIGDIYRYAHANIYIKLGE